MLVFFKMENASFDMGESLNLPAMLLGDATRDFQQHAVHLADKVSRALKRSK